MHLARCAWCRTYQTVFRIALPVLPYTEPRILEHAERERLPGHYRLWRWLGHGLCQGRGSTHRAAKQAHQQDARSAARPPSSAAAYCGSHYRRYGKRSHARGGYYR